MYLHLLVFQNVFTEWSRRTPIVHGKNVFCPKLLNLDTARKARQILYIDAAHVKAFASGSVGPHRASP